MFFLALLSVPMRASHPAQLAYMYGCKNRIQSGYNTWQAEKSKVLEQAVKEVGQMLSENLCDKFRATEEYRQIQDHLAVLKHVKDVVEVLSSMRRA